MYGLYNTEQTFSIDGIPYDVGYDRDYTVFLPQVFRPTMLTAPDFTPGPSGTLDPRVEPFVTPYTGPQLDDYSMASSGPGAPTFTDDYAMSREPMFNQSTGGIEDATGRQIVGPQQVPEFVHNLQTLQAALSADALDASAVRPVGGAAPQANPGLWDAAKAAYGKIESFLGDKTGSFLATLGLGGAGGVYRSGEDVIACEMSRPAPPRPRVARNFPAGSPRNLLK